MPLQNRVTPEGEIVAVPERGLFMGNRGGQIHRADKTLTARRWTSRAWITCALEYKGWHEVIMAPGRYTQLFFLDEATAFAAGHRPCALCRRADYNRFAEAWRIDAGLAEAPRAPAMDRRLHVERLTETRGKRTIPARFGELPDGAMARHDGAIILKAAGRARTWSFAGYRPIRTAASSTDTVEVLTPPSIIGVLRAGYRPRLHPTATETQ